MLVLILWICDICKWVNLIFLASQFTIVINPYNYSCGNRNGIFTKVFIGQDFGCEVALPLTQVAPTVPHNSNRLCWFSVTMAGPHRGSLCQNLKPLNIFSLGEVIGVDCNWRVEFKFHPRLFCSFHKFPWNKA